MMKNMVNHVFKLVKAGYYVKINIRKCLKKDKNSQAYILARFYDAYFKGMEEGDLTFDKIDALREQIDEHRVQNQGADDVQQLLSKIESFVGELKPFVRENLA